MWGDARCSTAITSPALVFDWYVNSYTSRACACTRSVYAREWTALGVPQGGANRGRPGVQPGHAPNNLPIFFFACILPSQPIYGYVLPGPQEGAKRLNLAVNVIRKNRAVGIVPTQPTIYEVGPGAGGEVQLLNIPNNKYCSALYGWWVSCPRSRPSTRWVWR